MNAAVRWTGSVVFAALAIFAFSTTPSASAGTYTATPNPCELLTYPLGSTWHSGYPGGGLWCASGFERSMALGSNSNGGRIWMKSQKLRDETYLKTFSMWSYYGDAGGPDAPLLWRICRRAMWEVPSAQQQCGGDTVALRGYAANWTTRAASNIDLVCGTHCAGVQFESQYNAVDANLAVSSVTASIGDDTSPSFTPAARQINSGQWLSGSVTLGGAASDNGGGVSSINLLLDMAGSNPSLAVNPNTGCTAGAWIPCPDSYTWSGTFNTATSPTLSDGPHTARYTVSDPAGNIVHLPQFTYRTDNTRPGTPGGMTAVADGINGWSAVNDFGASWTNTGETVETATQSGIAKVIVDVNPTSEGQTDPGPVTVDVDGPAVGGISATLDSVSGITVPAIGRWSLRLQLVDRAGNTSLVGDGSEGSANSDSEIGYDPATPAAPAGQANGWISRDELADGYDQLFDYIPFPGAISPVCGFAGAIDKNPSGTTGTEVNIPGGGDARSWRLPGNLDEDTHYVHIRSKSCNGQISAQTETVDAKVDRTDPVGTISGVEPGKWYRDGQVVTLSAVDVLSGMAPALPNINDSRRGAYLSYSVNGTGPADQDAPRGANADIPVTGEGAKELKFQPVDLAGNKAAAKTVAFGIDATDPIGHLDRQDPARPTLLTATLGDVPSGVDYAIFQIRRQGSGGPWEPLPTQTTNIPGTSAADAQARFPDTEKDAGIYDVRVAAFDQAGNQLLTQRYNDGSVASVENPMRKQSGVQIKLFRALRTCTVTRKKKGKTVKKTKCVVKKCTKKSKGTCYRVFRGRVELVGGSNKVTSEFKRGAVAAGVLTNENGKALANTKLTITTIDKFTGRARKVGETTTDSAGLYKLRVPAGVNRTVRATFEGTETRRPASSAAENLTRAKVTMKPSNKYSKTGRTVTFRGRVTAFDGQIPKGGKIVALQFYAGKRWRPAVGVAHTDQKGNFKIRYKFDGARVRAKIIFRAVAPSEDGWGHTHSVSKPKVVRLNWKR